MWQIIALRIYSHARWVNLFQGYYADTERRCNEDIGNAYKKIHCLAYTCLDRYTRQAVTTGLRGVTVKMVSEHEYAVPITHLLLRERQ